METCKITHVETGGRGLGGGTPQVEYFPGGVRVEFHLQRSTGMPDVDKIFEIPFAAVDSLPPPQEPCRAPGYYTNERRYVHVELPMLGKSLAFLYENWQENSGSLSEEGVEGPYLAPSRE